MKNDITKLTAYEIGVMLSKKNRPCKFTRVVLENYNIAEEKLKAEFVKYFIKKHLAEKSHGKDRRIIID